MHPGSRYLMAEEAPGSIHHLSNLASMNDPNVFELVWENDQILFRNLTSKMTSKNTGFPCSDHLPSKTSTASGSKDRVLDLGMSRLDLYDKNKINSYQNCMQAGYSELFPELYEDDDFNVVSRNYDREQIVPVNESRTFRENHPSKMDERTPHGLMNSDSEVPQSCLKQCEASVPFNRSKEKSSGIDEKSNKVNFSIFLRSPSLIKTIYPSSEAAEPTSINGFKDVNGNVEKEVSATGSNMNVILPDPELLPDQQSDTVGHKDTQQNTRFVDNSKFAEQVVPSSSLCSREASNCPSYTMERRYEDNDSRKNAVEEPEGKTKTSAARGSKGAKGKRKAEVHNLSERRRRGKINKKMRALKELIPNCNKVDKASMLDEAIEYLRTLQLQVQMMSMGGGVYMPPTINPMIATTAMQQLVNAQQLGGGFFPLGFGVGMGMRMHMGVGCSQMQFPTTSVMPLSAALPGMAEARFNMVGYPSQALLMSMSMSSSPFVSSGAGRFSLPQPIHASQAAAAAAAAIATSAAAQAKIPGGGASAIPLSTSRNSNPSYH